MNTLGVILARAGSQGLANKHLRLLLGRPVISYTLEHARQARSLSRVAVTSDCPLVRRFAQAEGFEVIERPAGLATADASVQDVMLHAVDEVERRDPGWRADALAVLYGNVPVRPADVIDRAVGHLRDTGCDSVRSFCPVGKWHPAWMSRLAGDRVEPLAPGSIHRRQDLEPVYLHDGAVVAVSREAMEGARGRPKDPHAFFGSDRRGILVGPGEAVEVDALRDLFIAEATLRERAEGPALARAG